MQPNTCYLSSDLQEMPRAAEPGHVLLDEAAEAELSLHPRLLELRRSEQTFSVIDLHSHSPR